MIRPAAAAPAARAPDRMRAKTPPSKQESILFEHPVPKPDSTPLDPIDPALDMPLDPPFDPPPAPLELGPPLPEPPPWVREPEESAVGAEAVAQVLEGLDPEQRRAVTHGAGPLLVVAGAGTGKTRVIVHRIAWLIAAKRAHPSEILALTFTERAAAEMEARVDVLVPYGYTDMWISTFHAFGDRIYREYALEIGLPDTARVLNEAERVVFFRERLFRLPLRRYLPLGNPVRHLQALVRLTARAKDEGIEPERYLALARQQLASAEAALSAADDDAARNAAAAAHGEARGQLELGQVYRAMEEELHSAGRIDFGDQLLLALKLLRDQPSVREALRRRFRYILVDEFQDTNTVQFEILKILAADHGNVTVVGDDDQSIYKFRGAALSNILGFSAVYPQRALVVLTRNYRSGQRILDAAHRLIAHNPDRLETRERIEKRLHASLPFPGDVEFQSFATLESEASAVAARVATMITGEGRAARDVAILVRSNRDAAPFLSALVAAGIPHEFSGNRGLFNREEVRLAIAFLRAITRRTDAQSLMLVAGSPIYAVPMTDLVQLADFARARRRSLHWALKEACSHGVAAMTSGAVPGLEALTPAGAEAIIRLAADLDRWVELARRQTTGEVLYQFLADTGILAELSAADTMEAEEKILNLGRFFSLVSRYTEVAVADRAPAFADHLDLLIEAGDDPQAADPDPDRDAVRVLTVHRAKGLEFPVVFAVNLVAQKFPLQERRDAIRLPVEWMGGGEGLGGDPGHPDAHREAPAVAADPHPTEPRRNLHLEEERRLFYVAMTRAREQLIFTSAEDHGSLRLRKPSQFIAEALDLPPAAARPSPVRQARERIARHAAQEAAATTAIRRGAETAGGPLDLSYTRLESYDACPLRYRFAYVLRMPSTPHHSQSYGKSMHEAIEVYLRARLAGGDPDPATLLDAFRSAWRSEGYLSREHEERRFEAGRQALVRFHAAESASGVRPAQIEKEFAFELPEAEVRVNGRYDRVDLDPHGATVIDYKTSLVDEQRIATKRARESMQLKLYALAYERQAGRLPLAGELRFVETGLRGAVAFAPEDSAAAAAFITRVAAGIRAGDFVATPAPDTCGGCAFQRVCPAAVW
jgi:DNA helicase II / ATP-dependent DNA helicase PcrA